MKVDLKWIAFCTDGGVGGEMNHLKGHFRRLINSFRSQAHYPQHHEWMRANINCGVGIGVGVGVGAAMAGSDCSRLRSQS